MAWKANPAGDVASALGLDLVTKLSAAGVVLLPFVGIVVRIVRFWGLPGGLDLGPRALGAQIAATLDPAELALAGLRADWIVLQWVFFWVVGYLALRMAISAWRSPPSASHKTSRPHETATLGGAIYHAARRNGSELRTLIRTNAPTLVAAVAATVMGLLYTLAYPVLSAVALGVVAFVGWRVLVTERAGPVSWHTAAGASVVIALCAAVAVGAQPWRPPAEALTFVPDKTLLADGWYGELGRTGDEVQLVRCDGTGPIVAVRPGDIATRSFALVPPATEEGLLSGRLEFTVGYVPGCTHP